jgi:RHS repeat-associated protein
MVNGKVTGGFAGITTSKSYNNRLLPTALRASSSDGTALSLSYTYFANGNVNVETNGRDNGRTATYTYDSLNRVSTASSQATSGSDCWGQSFGYDRYANLTTINVTQCTAPMLSLSVNTNNQITNTGFTYDADGDLTGDGTYAYSWNAEQHLTSAANVTYTYDGNLNRVKKSSGTLYWYSPAGVPLAETDTSGNTLNEYVFFGSGRVARRDSSGNVYYYFQDKLGTTGTLSNSSGVLCYDADFLPFGYEMAHVASCSQNYKFTSLERDGETGLDHTLNRKYDSSLGRWLTPDPKRGNVASPQSLNPYAYVLNNPANYVDPLGLDLCPPGYTFVEDAGAGTCVGYSPAGASFGSGGGPCSNIVVAGGLRPNIMPCGSWRAGGGGRRPRPSVIAWNLHKTGSDMYRIVSVLKDIQQCIDPTCLAFLQSGGGNLNSFISDLLGNNLLAAGNVSPNTIAAFSGTSNTNVPAGYAAIVVNDTGAFFNSSYSVDAGTLTGGSAEAQAFILLHELGHDLNAKGFQPDLNNPTAGAANDALIQKNCAATLNQFAH